MKNTNNNLRAVALPELARARWFATAPVEAGEYDFRCLETNNEVEIVPVESRSGTLWAKMDGLWNPVNYWHDGLSRPQWRKRSNDERSGPAAQDSDA